MITLDVDPSLPADVARRVATGRLPCWLRMSGDDPAGRDVLACDPARVVRGSSVVALAEAWTKARAAWGGGAPTGAGVGWGAGVGPGAGVGVPVGIGYLSYDLGRRFVRVRGERAHTSGWDDIDFRFYDAFWERQGEQARIQAVSAEAAHRLLDRLSAPDSPEAGAALGFSLDRLAPTESSASYLAAVARVLAYIQAGDVYQVNLARRLRARLTADGPPGLALFTKLRAQTDAPHAVWLADGESGRAVVGNSPERFLRVTVDGRVETSPIKGTRARAPFVVEDRRLGAELALSTKDRAEHVMIVDLERNDLGRVCETGSVEVTELMRLLSLPTVHHLTSTVRGRLRPDVDLAALIEATFPGGSITGAPKRRAMEIIAELEPAARGPYTGATGWLGAAGDLDLAIAIRTGLVAGDELTLWVGGGIVADSVPEQELMETETKARAFAALAAPAEDSGGPRGVGGWPLPVLGQH